MRSSRGSRGAGPAWRAPSPSRRGPAAPAALPRGGARTPWAAAVVPCLGGGRRAGEPAGAAAGAAERGWPLARAWRTRAFWMLGAAFSATWIPVFVPLVHIVPFARDLGSSALTGAWVVSTLGIGAVAGRLVMGGVSDRLGRRATLAIGVGRQCLGFLGFLAAARGPLVLFADALVFGYSYGTVSTLFPAIVGDFFGRGQTGAIVGFLFALAGAMAGWGPLIAGALHDATGSYGIMWVVCTVFNLLAVALLALSRAPREAPP